MTGALIWMAVLAAIVVAVYMFDRLGLWLEARGWIYYRTKRGSVSLGTALLETQALLDPAKQYMLEATRTEPEEGVSSDPPDPKLRREARPHERKQQSP